MSRHGLTPAILSLPLRPWLAALLLTLLVAPVVRAMGLGELTVISSLGQPFTADVALLDAPTGVDADCFHLSGATLPDVHLSVARDASGTVLLHIAGKHVFNVPFTEFSLSHACGTPLRRNYVALVDPPDYQAIAARENGPVTAPPPPPAVVATRELADKTAAAQAPAQARPSPARRHVTTHKPPARKPLPEHPKLVLTTESADEKEKSPGLAPVVVPREDELDDRMVALEHHADSLTATLAALRTRNAELDALLAEANTRPPKRNWGLVLVLLGVLAAGTGAAALLAHTRRTAPPDTPPVPKSTARPVAPGKRDDSLSEVAGSRLVEEGPVSAIKLLQSELREAPGASAVPWLLLIDLLRHHGTDDEYLATMRECKRRFNVDLEQVSRPEAKGLESYSNILSRLVNAWRSPAQALALTDHLLHDSRGGTRLGFSREAFDDLLLLDAIARAHQ